MRPLLDIVTTVCIGLLIGTEFAVAVFINPILRKLGAREELRAIRLFAAKLGAAMPFWYGVSLLLLIAEAIFRHGESGLPAADCRRRDLGRGDRADDSLSGADQQPAGAC